ncbi:hypothetical protein [Flavobacterium sp.]|uniref:hypothetical protein n=1 Tax=Flavobacterium sp. TaxID=239 RepID=UPI001204C407|nr:hypothetical protein [Flavobacterium sp.]RZJ71564.1 MAG: hypothetical protein EOO49_09405 [Flavobacterium sp.]
MKAQNLILRCNDCKMPNEKEFNEFVFQQLDNANVNYCGTTSAECNISHPSSGVLLNFHFKHPFEIDEESAIEKVTLAFYKKQVERIKSKKGEIDIFLS